GKAIEAKEPIARVTVKMRGFMGYGASLAVVCLDCARKNYYFAFADPYRWEPKPCAFCNRQVHDHWRAHRRRSFCCEDCRRKWKARTRPSQALATSAPTFHEQVA